MALAVVLVTAAGLLAQSLARLTSADLGFAREGRLVFSVALPFARYDTATRTADLFDRLIARIAATPGVVSVGATTALPLGREADFRLNFTVDGRPLASADDNHLAWYRMVSPGYFAAMGMSLREGRWFTEADREDSAPVVIVNEALVRRWVTGRSALGITMGAASGGFGPLGRILTRQPRIVGIVADVRQGGPERAAEPSIYYPLRQAPFRSQTVVVRANGDPAALAPAMRRIVGEIDPELPVADLRTLDQQVARATSAPRFRTSLIASFAGLALVLGAVGLYGVMSYAVASRAREIGVRLALGGRPADIRAMVLGQSMALVGLGTLLGLAAAWGAMRLLSGLLYEVAPRDPLTFAAVPMILAVTGLLASWLPTRRAASTDPASVLRQ
jgi:predicted permease